VAEIEHSAGDQGREHLFRGVTQLVLDAKGRLAIRRATVTRSATAFRGS